MNKWAAYNERFCVIGGVCPRESLWDFANFAPRTSGSEPPTTQSRRALSASGGQLAGLFGRNLTRCNLTVL